MRLIMPPEEYRLAIVATRVNYVMYCSNVGPLRRRPPYRDDGFVLIINLFSPKEKRRREKNEKDLQPFNPININEY